MRRPAGPGGHRPGPSPPAAVLTLLLALVGSPPLAAQEAEGARRLDKITWSTGKGLTSFLPAIIIFTGSICRDY